MGFPLSLMVLRLPIDSEWEDHQTCRPGRYSMQFSAMSVRIAGMRGFRFIAFNPNEPILCTPCLQLH